ncbi:MAG: DNA cytosine methyltransferase, partial [Desulfatiglandales bacterium]
IAYPDNRRQSRNLREEISGRKDKAISNSEFSSRNSRGSGIFRPLLIPEIRDFDGARYRGTTLLTGGFPCQPFSVAGQRRGKEDDRYLWPEMLRVISEAKPCWILAENVPGIFHMALDTVLADLEGEGYTTGTFIIPACSLNAPHRRNRVWIVGYSTGSRGWRATREIQKRKDTITNGTYGDASNSSSKGLQGNARRQFKGLSSTTKTSKRSKFSRTNAKNKQWQENWYEVATRFCRVAHGISDRAHRLRALGNAIVPQVAYEILKNIAWIENETN